MNTDLRDRIANDIRGWDAIDDHRTGTVGDGRTAQWLAENVLAAGLSPRRDDFDLQRWVLGRCAVEVNGTAAEGVPLFDGAVTDGQGVEAPLVALPGEAAGIGFGTVGGDAGQGANRAFADARRAGERPALVAVAKMNTDVPGLALQNADRFNRPFGPPALQVATEHAAWLRAAAASGEHARVVVQVAFEAAQGANVEARVAGRDPSLAPLVVMTPKSAWWVCSAERGGGIACWLALLRRFAAHQPDRDVLFVATSGHELGHLGLEHFLRANPALGGGAHAWIHLGANFAAVGSRTRLQASSEALLGLALRAMDDAGAPPADTTPLGQRPGGEARNIHDLGGRYVSYLGTNAWFHHPDDRWPNTIDLDRTQRMIEAMLVIAGQLALA